MQELSDNELLVVAALRVGELFHANVTQELGVENDLPWYEDLRSQPPNPFYYQTSGGLYLDFSHGVPCALWTPWGDWHFRGSGGGSAGQLTVLADKVMSRLSTRLFRDTSYDPIGGWFGPTYALLGVGELKLPEPTLRARREDCLSYAQAGAEWESLIAAVATLA